MTWHRIEERRPRDANDAEWIAMLENAVGNLLETIGNLDRDKVERYWPPHEGWAAVLSDSAATTEDSCPMECWHCEPISISAETADWIDPDGRKPAGWRAKIGGEEQ